MGSLSWDVWVSIIGLLAAVGFAVVLLIFTIQQKPKTVPIVGLACSIVLMVGVTLAAQLPNLLGGGIHPSKAVASAPSSAASSPATGAAQTPSSSKISRIQGAEDRMKQDTARADATMKSTESRFAGETSGSSVSSGAQQASSATSSGIRILHAPGVTAHGKTAQLMVQGKPNTQYTVKVIYDSGSVKGSGSTMRAQTDAYGRAAWAWTVGSDIAPGAHFITITGGGETVTTSFKTT
ncbi:MAG: hypothetical protein LKF71_03150 [Oscillospiraceae bacterium]|jgi:hypothetical protein|nr:hypothetical protein [Oscillospiraceae bacterium]